MTHMTRVKCVLIAILIPILAIALGQTAAPAVGYSDCFGGPCPPVPPRCENGAGVITGTVTDEDGNAVAGAEVMLFGETSFALAETDDDGAYRAEQLCAGDYEAQAMFWDEENPDQVLVGYYDADGNGEPDLVSLPQDDSTAGGIDITLAVIDWEPEPLPYLPELPPVVPMPDPVLPVLPVAPVGTLQ